MSIGQCGRYLRGLVVVALCSYSVTWALCPHVPAPRSMPAESTSPSNPAESTLTLTSEVMQRAGIKVEAVGEQVSTEAASSALTTE